MKGGQAIFSEVCCAANPAAAVAELSDAELEQLDGALTSLPDTGVPGVIKAQVTADQARRWRVDRQAELERGGGE
ncbi:hypothetical protein [Haloferula sargassicola]|uniref:Uncharacterized protein n=1 Tax=Haloferula sargassicola TaxID=490096 RepID=A0ABP9UKF0_9BACT